MEEDLLLSFDDLEQRHWWFVVRRKIVLDALERYASPRDADILEVGCGTGGLLHELESLYPHARVRGVEPVDTAAQAACAKGCTVDVATFEALPAGDDSVDVLIALDVLEHCADDRASLREAWRVMRPGATLLLTVPALPSMWSAHDEVNAHYRRYVRETLEAPATEVGFEIERVTYFNSLLLPGGWTARVASRLGRSSGASGLGVPPRPLNRALVSVFSFESAMLRRTDMPLGTSLMLVARKPA